MMKMNSNQLIKRLRTKKGKQMKCKKYFLILSIISVSTTSPMLITTKHAPKAFFNTQKMSKTFTIPVGKSSLTFYNDILPDKLDMQELLPNVINAIGKQKCTAQDFTQPIYGCQSNTCCRGAAFLGMQKNIQAAQRSHAIKDNFLKSIGKRDHYLKEIKYIYLELIKYKVFLNEFSSDLSENKRSELYTMLENINDCLFTQARVIVGDTLEDWKDNKFTMTPTIENIRTIRDSINEWHENEKEYYEAIEDQNLKFLYKQALVSHNINSYKINRIEEEYKLSHKSKPIIE